MQTNGNEHPVRCAPGWPGVEPTWAFAAKSGVGCGFSAGSGVWFALSRGIVTEVFCPAADEAAIRDLGFVVTGPQGFFSEEQYDCAVNTRMAEPGIPVYTVAVGSQG